jgi:TetR/AcrR family transcriptional regulator, tetracycline repressor protein
VARPNSSAKKSAERPPVTRESIAMVAVESIRGAGIDALTMRTLAAQLGVSAMALYYHVADKDEVLRLVADEVLAAVQLPDPDDGPWDELLSDAVRATHAAISSVPGLGSVLLTRTLLPNARRILFFGLHQFERAGLSRAEARLAYAGLQQLSIGHLMVESSANFETHGRQSADDDLGDYIDALHSAAAFDRALAALLAYHGTSPRTRR